MPEAAPPKPNPLQSGCWTDLPPAEVADFQDDLADTAADCGVPISFWQEPQPGGLVTLNWFVPAVPAAAANDPPPAPPPAAGSVAAGILEAAGRVGVDPRLLAAFAAIESGLQPAAAAKTSTARGLFQITDGTWAGLVAKYGAKDGVAAADRAGILPQCLMGAELMQENRTLLRRRLGREPDGTAIYCGHFLGPAAAALLAAPREAVPLAVLQAFFGTTALGAGFADRALAANRPIFLDQGRPRSCGEVLDLLGARVAKGLATADALLHGAPAPPPHPPPAPPAPATGDTPWLAAALAEEAADVAEVPGAGNNQRIVNYFAWTSLGPQPDAVAWCGAFVSFCLGQAGIIQMGRGRAQAVAWRGFGTPLMPQPPHAGPRIGALMVLKPQASKATGHVGFLVALDANKVTLLGGNQSDKVCRTSYGRDQVQPDGWCWPS